MGSSRNSGGQAGSRRGGGRGGVVVVVVVEGGGAGRVRRTGARQQLSRKVIVMLRSHGSSICLDQHETVHHRCRARPHRRPRPHAARQCELSGVPSSRVLVSLTGNYSAFIMRAAAGGGTRARRKKGAGSSGETGQGSAWHRGSPPAQGLLRCGQATVAHLGVLMLPRAYEARRRVSMHTFALTPHTGMRTAAPPIPHHPTPPAHTHTHRSQTC